jgi:Helix-turn-helix domain
VKRQPANASLTDDERRRVIAKGFYTPEQAARVLVVTAHHVRNLCHAGVLRYNRIHDQNGNPHLIRIPIVELEEYQMRTLVPRRDDAVA